MDAEPPGPPRLMALLSARDTEPIRLPLSLRPNTIGGVFGLALEHFLGPQGPAGFLTGPGAFWTVIGRRPKSSWSLKPLFIIGRGGLIPPCCGPLKLGHLLGNAPVGGGPLTARAKQPNSTSNMRHGCPAVGAAAE